MALTWKDLVTTVLAILVAVFSYLFVTGYHFPLLSGYRSAVIVLSILGIGMCAMSSAAGASGPWVSFAGALGVISAILIVSTLILGTKALFLAVTGIILLLWGVATLRHIIGV